MPRQAIVPPQEKANGKGEWTFTGWPHGAGLGVWLRRRRSGTEISTNEVLVEATAPEGSTAAGLIRVYQYARMRRNGGRERAVVVMRNGSWQVRLDLVSAEALAGALRLVTGRPCQCGELSEVPGDGRQLHA